MAPRAGDDGTDALDSPSNAVAVAAGLADLRRRKRIRLALGLGYLPFVVAVVYATGSATAALVGAAVYMLICQLAHNSVLHWPCPVCGDHVHVYTLFGWITSARGTPRACPHCGLSLRSPRWTR